MKLILDGYGDYLGMEKGSYIVKDKSGNVENYPVFENLIDEVILKSGNLISTGALSHFGFWEIDVLFLTRKGRPVAYLKSLDDYSHVKTRLKQYEAFNNDKRLYISKQISRSKFESQNIVLKKYGLKTHPDKVPNLISNVNLKNYKKKLMAIEGQYSMRYFKKILKLIPENIRPKSRKRFRAFDGVNNIFNLAYEVLGWKILRALLKVKLEPYLGFLHSLEYDKPSLVCDFKELYRYLMDVFVIEYSQVLKEKDFILKFEKTYRDRMGKRQYLKDSKTRDMIRKIYDYLETRVEIPRISWGKVQSIETLINGEATLFAQYIRDEKKSWEPRIPSI